KPNQSPVGTGVSHSVFCFTQSRKERLSCVQLLHRWSPWCLPGQPRPDNRLRLPETVFSYVLQDWEQGFCVEEAFGQAAWMIERILGLKQSVDSLEHMNEHMANTKPTTASASSTDFIPIGN